MMVAMGTTTTSPSLLEGIRVGNDPRAWQEFFHTYAPFILAFAKRLGLSDADAADTVQDTMLAVHTTFRRLTEPFDRTKGRFKAWLRGIAQHKVRDVQRRRAKLVQARTQRAVEEADAVAAVGDMDQAFETEWRRALLGRALTQVAREIDPAVYQAFELTAVHGQSPVNVAKLLGVTRNAVYISKTRVLQRVRTTLNALIEAEG
jgi:RNA polymerase sigma factor (sigma-70 family)